MECQYALLSFGVSPDIISIDQTGKMKEGMIEAFIEKRTNKESGPNPKEPTTGGIDTATDKDVLLGRGKPYQNHPGNVQLKKLIEVRREEFNNAPKFQKTVISWEILKMMQNEYQARFLEKDETTGKWKVCEDEAARIKVAYGFRARPKPQPKTRPVQPPVNMMARTFMQFTNWGVPQDAQHQNERKSHLDYNEPAVDHFTKRHRMG